MSTMETKHYDNLGEIFSSEEDMAAAINLMNTNREEFYRLYPSNPFPEPKPTRIKPRYDGTGIVEYICPHSPYNLYFFSQAKYDPRDEAAWYAREEKTIREQKNPALKEKRLNLERWIVRGEIAAVLAGLGLLVATDVALVGAAGLQKKGYKVSVDIELWDIWGNLDGESEEISNEKTCEEDPTQEKCEVGEDANDSVGTDIDGIETVPGGSPEARAKRRTIRPIVKDKATYKEVDEVALGSVRKKTMRERLEDDIAEAIVRVGTRQSTDLQCIAAVRTTNMYGSRPANFLGSNLKVGDNIKMFVALEVPASGYRVRYKWDYDFSKDVKWEVSPPKPGVHVDEFIVGEIPESAGGTTATFTVTRLNKGRSELSACTRSFTIAD